MPTFFDAPRAYLNFALGLRAYLKNTATESEINETIIGQIANRDKNFVQLIKANVFENPQSPYLPLFNAAKLSYDDVEQMVTRQGLEQTLEELYDADVYVTFEEFKGRVPIKRGSVEFLAKDSDFDSLNLTPIMFGQTGGSTGKPAHTRLDLDYMAQTAHYVALEMSVHSRFDAPMVIWRGLLPDFVGVAAVLRRAYLGQTVDRWFTTLRGNDANMGWYYTLLTYLMIYMGKFHGNKFPMPEYVSLDAPLPIAQALADMTQKMGMVTCCATTSKCVRVCVIAKQHNIDLTGVVFYGGSEPCTPTKIETIEATGAKFVNHYGTTETGAIGLACANATDPTDVHFLSNHLALIQRPQQVRDQSVNAIYYTNLLPSSPKMLINVQLDDFGIVEERDCGCPLYHMGFTKHIRQTSSFSKLTSEGTTLIGNDVVHILEHVLPSQFGGNLLNYQLVEEENQQGFTKLVLYVDPSVPIQDETVLRDTFLDALKHSMPSARLAQAEYRTGDVVSIRREKPFVTSRGKHFPIRTLNMRG